MVQLILQDARPSIIYSIGTAGGTRPDVRLGDTVVTNAAKIQLQKPENAGAGIDGQSFVCPGPFPSTDLLAQVQAQLMFRLSNVATYPALENALAQVHQKVPDSARFTLDDLLNDALRPEDLHEPRALPMAGTPLLTTDYYYIATGADASQWAVLEMDDAVIGYVAAQAGVDFAFFRNISDPLVPAAAADGTPIPDDVRDGWSGQIYQAFGLYTSFNGALTAWAAIAGRG
jgi:nucleoside phosphorylase